MSEAFLIRFGMRTLSNRESNGGVAQICVDLVDPGRVNIFEGWESQAALETFRRSGPDTEQRPAMLTVSQEYDIADVRPVFGKEA